LQFGEASPHASGNNDGHISCDGKGRGFRRLIPIHGIGAVLYEFGNGAHHYGYAQLSCGAIGRLTRPRYG